MADGNVKTEMQSKRFAVDFFLRNIRRAGAEKRAEKRLDAQYVKFLKDIGAAADVVEYLGQVQDTHFMEHPLSRMYEQYKAGKR